MWTVCDTKLARSAGVAALLQIAAYAEELRVRGVPTAPVARLILGDRSERDFALDDILPVYRERRSRLEAILAEHLADPGPAGWGDDRWLGCGRCDECLAAIETARDVLLVAGVHTSQRKRLRAGGVETIDELAVREEPVADLAARQLEKLRAQAALQLRQEGDGEVRHEIFDPACLRVIPPPSPGDIFFDFEGDPLWSDRGDPDWGLEYLFGVVDLDPAGHPAYRAFWAHDRREEKQALLDFLAYVRERRAAHPDLHIYHYAAYEKTALLRLAARHGVGEDDVDDLLRDGVLVDLYAVVRSAVRVSQPSYSIKKLEPLYMGDDLREGEVTTAGDSIVVYHEYTDAVVDERADDAARLLEDIRSYNEYDCVSTLRLRDWLVDRAREHGVVLGGVPVDGDEVPAAEGRAPRQMPEVEGALWELVPDRPALERTRDEWALAMLAAAVQYNRREQKPYWWSHFDRLRNPVDEWAQTGEVFQIDSGEVMSDWSKEGRQRSLRRTVRLAGRFGGGSALRAGGRVWTIYDDPVPGGMVVEPGHMRSAGGEVRVVERILEPDGEVLVVEEMLGKGIAPHEALPIALTPVAPPQTGSIDAAIEQLAQGVVSDGGRFPAQAGLDLLRRQPPRTRSGGLTAVGSGPPRFVDAVTAAVLDLDRSYLGVQGPPGTGKTFVASHVITRLVRDHGWKIGVVAQSHAVVENVLDALVSAGLPPELVAKNPSAADLGVTPRWTAIDKDGVAAFCADHASSGYVVGGTAWDLTNRKRIVPGQLDLVVVDEAGQFNLASTIACSTAGSRLLLLGDPQQLPQVSQGHHPEPVDGSALGWLLRTDDGGRVDVIPPDLGYFLDTTWRMHPALADRVSHLSYAGALRSEESVTTARMLDGVDPGVHVVLVEHHDNTVASVEEADTVVGLVRDLVGRTWTDPSESSPPVGGSRPGLSRPGLSRPGGRPGDGRPGDSRPLAEHDILVVSPYNAQVALVTETLAAAGLGGVEVGSVDRFQGREAAVVILTMAASAGADISRGIGFLLNRNRLNVSVSRGKYAAYLVRSSVLTDFAPRSTNELLALGAFIGLCAGAPTTHVRGAGDDGDVEDAGDARDAEVASHSRHPEAPLGRTDLAATRR
ncbi:conserved hypothetical protein [Nostocoides japonicum T1-X7]|uniref:Uncharacterized protein n=1 Tax=Nostocoides japonicum T1-X7 TaxID=1194083 RepID=A0A077M128_9MICO|nr:conserved hypothetical protein [Tetrasphaera japonica T1-X7]